MYTGTQRTDLVLVEVEFEGLQLPHSVRYAPNLVFREIYHIQMSQATELRW